MDHKVKASGRSKTHYGLVLSPDFWPPRSLSARVESPLSQKSRGGSGWRSLNLLLKHGFACLCPCRNYYLKAFTRSKDWLFILFLLSLPFQRANRRLIVNALPGAQLSVVSRKANCCKYPAWSRLLRGPWNINRRKCLTWTPSFPSLSRTSGRHALTLGLWSPTARPPPRQRSREIRHAPHTRGGPKLHAEVPFLWECAHHLKCMVRLHGLPGAPW